MHCCSDEILSSEQPRLSIPDGSRRTPAPPQITEGSGRIGRRNPRPVNTSTYRRISASKGRRFQSACFRRNAGISISSIPLLASASTFAAAVRPFRHTLGVVSAL